MDESVGLGRRDRFAHWPRAMRMSCRSSTSTSPHAGSTWLLFRADWGAVLWRVYQKMDDNRLLAVAAGVVFYGLLAVFPAVTAFVSLYGLMADPSTIHERLALATDILPQGAEYPERATYPAYLTQDLSAQRRIHRRPSCSPLGAQMRAPRP